MAVQSRHLNGYAIGTEADRSKINSKREPYMLTNQNSTAFWVLDNLWMPLASSHHTQDNLSLMEQVCGTGIGGPQAHMHPTDLPVEMPPRKQVRHAL